MKVENELFLLIKTKYFDVNYQRKEIEDYSRLSTHLLLACTINDEPNVVNVQHSLLKMEQTSALKRARLGKPSYTVSCQMKKQMPSDVLTLMKHYCIIVLKILASIFLICPIWIWRSKTYMGVFSLTMYTIWESVNLTFELSSKNSLGWVTILMKPTVVDVTFSCCLLIWVTNLGIWFPTNAMLMRSTNVDELPYTMF